MWESFSLGAVVIDVGPLSYVVNQRGADRICSRDRINAQGPRGAGFFRLQDLCSGAGRALPWGAVVYSVGLCCGLVGFTDSRRAREIGAPMLHHYTLLDYVFVSSRNYALRRGQTR